MHLIIQGRSFNVMVPNFGINSIDISRQTQVKNTFT